MKKQIFLELDSDIVDAAFTYSERMGCELSKMIEKYLCLIAEEQIKFNNCEALIPNIQQL